MENRWAEILLEEIRGVRERVDDIHEILDRKADREELVELRKELTTQGKELSTLKGRALGVSAAVSAAVALGPAEITKSIFKSVFSNS